MMRPLFLVSSIGLGAACFAACSAEEKPTPEATTPAAANNQGDNEPAAPAGQGVELDRSNVMIAFGKDPEPSTKVRNRLTKAKVALGQELFNEARLSRGEDISCATCHILEQYGQDGKPTSPGTGGAAGVRNTPTVYNAARQFMQFWDFRADSVEQQATMPILTANEHGLKDEAEIESILKGIPEYAESFKKAFPKDAEPITAENVRLAIGAFERKKLVTRSRWDDYLDGDDSALTDEEKRGLNLFVSTGCTTCHVSKLVGGSMSQKLGLLVPAEGDLAKDKGRFEVTGKAGDEFYWKVPQLLNVEKTAPYLHDGSVATLEEATKIMAKLQLGKDLSDAQVASIVTFLKALTGPLPKL